MSITLAVNKNNDIYLGTRGNLVLAVDLQAVLQSAQQAVQTLLGELLYNTNRGMPNFQLIWNGTPNLPQYRVALQSLILTVPGVTEVISIDLSFSNNILSYSAIIATTFGTGTISNG